MQHRRISRATNKKTESPQSAEHLENKTVPEPPTSDAKSHQVLVKMVEFVNGLSWCTWLVQWQPRQESNLDQTFRKRLFYPLNYGAVRQRNIAPAKLAEKSPAPLGAGPGPFGGRPLGRGGQYWIRTSDLSRVRRTL